MGAYDKTTLAEARSSLAALLGRPDSSLFWTDAELDSYLKEAISTWATASLAYRTRDTFHSISGQDFYDLTEEVGDLALTSTNRDIASQLEYSLIELQTTDWTTWGGTSQFSLEAIGQAIQRARDQFLLETGMILTPQEIPTSSPPVSRVNLPQSTLDLRRVASKSLEGIYRTLAKEDEGTLNAYSPGWNIPIEGTQPDFYSIISEPTLSLQLAPIATDITSLQLLLILSGDLLGLDTEVELGIPEPFYWVIKYGALYELLGPHSQAHDPLRAKYCKLRWDEGIALAKIYPSILNLEINGQQTTLSALIDLDLYNWNWQNTSGISKEVGVASWNLLALSPVPNSNEVSVTIDFISNPPIPSADSDFIQVDEAIKLTILEFARHLALFKVGGGEFLASRQGYDRMVQAASLQNARLRSQALFFSSLTGSITREATLRPFKEEDQQPQEEVNG